MIVHKTQTSPVGTELSDDAELVVAGGEAGVVSASLLMSGGSGCYVGLVENHGSYQASHMRFCDGDTLEMLIAVNAASDDRTISVSYCRLSEHAASVLSGSSLSFTPSP
jgi:hypothetical protein